MIDPDGASATTTLTNFDTWRVDVGVRTSGDFDLTNSFTRYRHTGDIGNTNFGWGAASTTIDVDDMPLNASTGGFMGNTLGFYIRKGDWKPYASYVGGTDLSLVTARNLFAYLGPAGLFLYLGSSTLGASFGDLIAAGFVFAGGRIPGRALLTGDVNLPRINPIVPIPMLEGPPTASNTLLWDGTRLRTMLHGIQHDANAQMDIVIADLFNLENVEIPITPDNRPHTLESPRQLTTGQGAHILGRMVVVPRFRRADTTELMGKIRASVTTGETRPDWFEVFTAPRFRFGDKTAPIGDFQDPSTLDNWRIVPHPKFGTLALYSENAVVGSSTSVGTLTEQAARTYDFAPIDQNTTTSFATTVPVVSLPAGATMSCLIFNGGVNNARWKSPSSQDLLIADLTDMTSANQQTELDLTIVIPAGESADSLYRLRFNARVRGGNAGPQGVNQPGSNPQPYFLVFSSINGVFTSVFYIFSAGANTAHSSFNFTQYDVALTRDGQSSGSPIIVRLRANVGDSQAASPVIEVQTLSLRRYRYI